MNENKINQLINMGYRSQVSCPYTQLNTIDLCTFTLITIEVESKEQVNSNKITGLLY